MNRKDKIQEEIGKTINAADNEQLKPDPYFYSKLITEIESRGKEKKGIARYLNPALLVLLILFNALTIVSYLDEDSTASGEASANEQLMEILRHDFHLSAGTDQSIF
ncbi:MAG: hypothetical protein K9J16_18120 [Melioribacteraceae bacterium]|nr:hypothetical protein [Melioribacteraceae bacterium]MCF8356751.1 hypothetical protein [Melioribacteraceae bacterium]MCF8396144.1 hypothetical protein [Melioribacteraceae bacterium]MCF8421121.1 hypothetical protein [Melioribacteraceae bacterium]